MATQGCISLQLSLCDSGSLCLARHDAIRSNCLRAMTKLLSQHQRTGGYASVWARGVRVLRPVWRLWESCSGLRGTEIIVSESLNQLNRAAMFMASKSVWRQCRCRSQTRGEEEAEKRLVVRGLNDGIEIKALVDNTPGTSQIL